MHRRALFIVNRRSRNGGRFADQARLALERRGFDLVEPPDDRARGPAAVPRGVGLAIVGGGDGTLNGAVDALAHLRIPVGILPLGTANDFARSLGIPRELDDACDVIASGRTRRIDLGTVNGRYFLNDVSLGLSTNVAARLQSSVKRRFGVFAAAGIALRAATRARRFRVTIYADRRRYSILAYQVTVGNGIYLGGLIANFDASIDDGRLDLYALQTKRASHVARMLPFAVAGRYDANPFVLTKKCRHYRIETQRPMRLFTDGEPAGTTPARIAVASRALRVFVP